MALTKVLVTVKTYPAISSKYDELVCTAGFREDGTWIRIYPIQFRKKSYDQQYKKYDWIELDLVKNDSDFRPESFRPYSHDSEIKIVRHLETDHNWAERKKFALGKIYYNLTELIAEAQNKNICLHWLFSNQPKYWTLPLKRLNENGTKIKLQNWKQSVCSLIYSNNPKILLK